MRTLGSRFLIQAAVLARNGNILRLRDNATTAGSPDKALPPSPPCVSGRYPGGRRRLAGTGEKRAGSDAQRLGRGPTPAKPGEGDAQNPMQNSALKIQAENRKRITVLVSMASALFAGIGGSRPCHVHTWDRLTRSASEHIGRRRCGRRASPQLPFHGAAGTGCSVPSGSTIFKLIKDSPATRPG